jgi:hypothetical protein
MPDHPRGYVRRTARVQPTDEEMAEHYRRQQRESAVSFKPEHLELLTTTACAAATHLDAVCRAVAGELTHLHVLFSWSHSRAWKPMRNSVQSALTRALNTTFGRRTWFAESRSRKRVGDHEHHDYLVLSYLAEHTHCWRDAEALARAQARDARRAVSVTTRRKDWREQ